ncbi:twin-arginine translocase TatA/TatE family subunit [Psychroflexus planctonicus]|uniref:Sec-independent protein translocase protein TatA n=1 Tax=Psychroflexus planctonicus TaxID=1526575 RepID=A0ABQ1SNG8_9FLAO|nr:twin-arginine translocase TatA/TatE family subunit [Psychroflexus planctonicus]GGE43533.1 Sec-independent protein translocase [Psychroflexus planctonicus]
MNLIYFISGGEIAIILLIVVMVFGADKIPDIARNLGKAAKSVKNATDEIKSEINKSSERTSQEFDKVDITKQIDKEAAKVKDDIDEITGPVKRRF